MFNRGITPINEVSDRRSFMPYQQQDQRFMGHYGNNYNQRPVNPIKNYSHIHGHSNFVAHLYRTVRITGFPQNATNEEILPLFEKFGPILQFSNQLMKNQSVYVTYYDLRAAEKARKQLASYNFNDSIIFTVMQNDFNKICDMIELNVEMQHAKITADEIKVALSVYNEPKTITEISPKVFQVQFYDARIPNQIVSKGQLLINGVLTRPALSFPKDVGQDGQQIHTEDPLTDKEREKIMQIVNKLHQNYSSST